MFRVGKRGLLYLVEANLKLFFQNELQKANKFFCCLIIKGSKCSVELVVGIRR